MPASFTTCPYVDGKHEGPLNWILFNTFNKEYWPVCKKHKEEFVNMPGIELPTIWEFKKKYPMLDLPDSLKLEETNESKLAKSNGFTTYVDNYTHQIENNLKYHCDTLDVYGIDGFQHHWGMVFQLRKNGLPIYQGVFACQNHTEKYILDGYYFYDYGYKDNQLMYEEYPYFSVQQHTSYIDSNKHFEKEKLMYICEHDGEIGDDGTLHHFGMVFQLKHSKYSNGYACENHCKKFLKEGYFICTYGTQESKYINQSEKPYVFGTKNMGEGRVITKEKVAGGWNIRTQKAKGVLALRKNSFDTPDFKIYDVNGIEPGAILNKFVRPCPMRPRHGFVDSRKVETLEQANSIIRETLEADPDSEFILMPFINAEFSGIWTPGHLAIGRGTDGATAGTTAITIPVLGDLLAKDGVLHSESARKNADIKENPYVELLWTINEDYEDSGVKCKYVQLRDGPKLPNEVDYVLEEIEVKNIIKAEGDLLEWETKMKSVPPNTVISHVGGSLASHYSIHAVLNKIPVLISREPVIGEILKPNQASEPTIDIQAMRAGFSIGCNMVLNYQQASSIMLAGCHHITIWKGRYDLLLGLAMGCAWRLTVTASLGEARHHKDGASHKKSREYVYEKIWKKTDTQYGRVKFSEVVDLFLNGNKWPGSNYGGRNWFNFSACAVKMYNSLIRKHGNIALEQLNQLVHAVHNGGWGFNKFVHEQELNEAAKNPVCSAAKCAPFIYQAVTADKNKLKSSARTFWKRKPLLLPVDKGTSGNLEEWSEEEEYDPNCTCDVCASIKEVQEKKKKPHVVLEAQAIYNPGKGMLHVQWKSEEMYNKQYFTKDYPTPIAGYMFGLINKVEGVQTNNSFSGSNTKYIKLEKKEDGWYHPDVKGKKDGLGYELDKEKFHKIMPLEEIPNVK